MLIATRQKYINFGAFTILSEQEGKSVLKGPHYFIKSFMVRNDKSISTPKRQVMHTLAYNYESKTSLNASMHRIPCRTADMALVILSFMIYEFPISLDIANAFHNVLIENSQKRFQLMMSFKFKKIGENSRK